MNSVVTFLGLLVVFAVLVLVVPVGLAVADTWTTSTTNSLITAGATVCGSGAVLVAMMVGAVMAARFLTSHRTAQEGQDRQQPPYDPRYTTLDPYRQAQLDRLQVLTARDQLRLAQDRQQLLSPPTTSTWDLQQADWELVDGTAGSQEDGW